MTTLSQIAEKAEEYSSITDEPLDTSRNVIRALIDTPWNCPSEINEQVAKSMVRKYVLEEDDGL